MNKIKVIIFGCGYWGQKIISNLEKIEDICIVGICDSNNAVLEKYKDKYTCYNNFEEIKMNPYQVYDCGFVITRAHSHFDLTKKLLESGKDVFLEKPMTLNSKEADFLVKLAKKKWKVLSVDHTFLFATEINFLKTRFFSNPYRVKFLESKRVNKGPFSIDLNVVWDLAPHDFSILNHIVPFQPEGISANGVSVINNIIEKSHITVHYKNTDFKAFIEVSWLEQDKLRFIRLVDEIGQEIKYNSNNDKIISFGSYKDSIINEVPLDIKQSLFEELKYFVDCLKNFKHDNLIDGKNGLQVVKMLEATDLSIKKHGKMIKL